MRSDITLNLSRPEKTHSKIEVLLKLENRRQLERPNNPKNKNKNHQVNPLLINRFLPMSRCCFFCCCTSSCSCFDFSLASSSKARRQRQESSSSPGQWGLDGLYDIQLRLLPVESWLNTTTESPDPETESKPTTILGCPWLVC